MTIVIADALPPLTSASALGEPFASRYPKTVDWFNTRSPQITHWPIAAHGCTPVEGWQLTETGFNPSPGVQVGAGLAPWLLRLMTNDVPSQPEPIWLAALCSTVISQERATAVPLSLLNVEPAHIDALIKTASPLFSDDGDGIELMNIKDGFLRVNGDLPATSRTITPFALMGQDLGDWWPTGADWRPWRKRVNELQMAWHDHPVNQVREQQGLAAINSLWLFGGGLSFEPAAKADYRLLDRLSMSALEGDWATWLDKWVVIEAELLAADPDQRVILTGPDCLVQLSNAPKRWWQQLLTKKSNDAWRDWWINRK